MGPSIDEFRAPHEFAAWLLEQEARALLTRLNMLYPFVMFETMVPAAAPSPQAVAAVHAHLAGKSRALRHMVGSFVEWIRSAGARGERASTMQQRFTVLRLQFNAVISQFDIFADVFTQRSEHRTGVLLAGLDRVAADALELPGNYFEVPPVLCYLDRGQGAAIRRARTRLPGGGDNPAAVIRVPRERMIGSGIASSLVHECGHQAASLLDLVASLRGQLRSRTAEVWRVYERWISEIVADFWSVARIGIGSTMGLIGVVSLPKSFVFRISPGDPHPVPWIRVLLSARVGATLYPDPQWERARRTWLSFYPPESARFGEILAAMDDFVELLVHHRPPALRGATLGEAVRGADRTPQVLRSLWRRWEATPRLSKSAAPSLVFAAIGQARADGVITPEHESRLLGEHLSHWALQGALDSNARCAMPRVAHSQV